MNRKVFKIFSIAMATLLVTGIFFPGLLEPLQVSALAVTPKPTVSLQNKIADIKTRAGNEIDRRVDRLTVLIDQIYAMKRLSATQKTSFVNDIQNTINNLKSLKITIQNETELAALKTEVQSIVDSYRIFLLYVPKIRILSAAERQLTTVDSLNTLAQKLNGYIQTAQGQGKDVTALLAEYSDLVDQVAKAQTDAQSAFDKVKDLTPAGYPGNKGTLTEAQQLCKTVRQELQTAVTDAKAIRDGLRALFPQPTVTP